MPCYTASLNQTLLEGRNPNILKDALEDMGFSVFMSGNQLSFSGVNKVSGKYHSGSYIDGVLSNTGTLEIKEVKKSYAAQVAANTMTNNQGAKAQGLKIVRRPNGQLITLQR